MKINIGDLVNERYNMDEVISYVSKELSSITKNLITDCNQNAWSGIGAGVNQLGQLSAIMQKLDEKVNGKKANPVL